MTDTKFTPGPWETHKRNDEDRATLVVMDGENVADCNFFPRKNSHHNAHLISAAPELYEVTDPFDEWFKFHAADAPEWNEADTVKVYLSIGELRAIKAARAKARGESD